MLTFVSLHRLVITNSIHGLRPLISYHIISIVDRLRGASGKYTICMYPVYFFMALNDITLRLFKPLTKALLSFVLKGNIKL